MAVLLATPSPPLPSASLPGTGHVPPGARGRAGDPPEPPDTAGSREPSQRWVPAPCAPCPASASCCFSPPLTPSHPKQGGGKKVIKNPHFHWMETQQVPGAASAFETSFPKIGFAARTPQVLWRDSERAGRWGRAAPPQHRAPAPSRSQDV